MILGILQTGHMPEEVRTSYGDYTALYGRMFPGRGYELRTFSVVDGVFPSSLTDADAWLVTGSRHGAYEDHPWIPPLESLLRDIRSSGQPLIGICFGHQIIAQAFGGKVEKYKGGWHVGLQRYRIGGREMALNAWHQDQITVPPDGATILGTADFSDYAVLAYGDRVLTLQPHPEFGSGVIERLIERRSDTVPTALLDAARAALDKSNDNALIHRWLTDVLEGQPATRVPFATNVRA